MSESHGRFADPVSLGCERAQVRRRRFSEDGVDEAFCPFRVAVGETLIELPAGTLDPGEDPAEAARRELIEETGYRAETIERLCEFFMSPGILNERMVVFVATGLQPGETALEAGEQIEPLLVTLPEALELVRNGEIRDAKSIAALLFYERFNHGLGGRRHPS